MSRAAETANNRELRIKAKLQEARVPHLWFAASFADAARPIAVLRRCTTRTRRHAVCYAALRVARSRALHLTRVATSALTLRAAAHRPRTSPCSCRRRSRRPSTIATSCRRSTKPRAGASNAKHERRRLLTASFAFVCSRARARSEKRQMEEQVNKLHSENQARALLARLRERCALTRMAPELEGAARRHAERDAARVRRAAAARRGAGARCRAGAAVRRLRRQRRRRQRAACDACGVAAPAAPVLLRHGRRRRGGGHAHAQHPRRHAAAALRASGRRRRRHGLASRWLRHANAAAQLRRQRRRPHECPQCARCAASRCVAAMRLSALPVRWRRPQLTPRASQLPSSRTWRRRRSG